MTTRPRAEILAVGIACACALALGVTWAVTRSDDEAVGAADATSTMEVEASTTSTTVTPASTTATTAAPTTSVRPEPSSGPRLFPIQGTTTIEYARSHHDYPAADIFAPCGSSFVAVTDGIVHELSREDLYSARNDDPALRSGLFVSLVDDQQVRYYGSHLASVADGIEAGTVVRRGQVLGTVGDTGNAAGTGCHLHFGLSSQCRDVLGDWETRRGTIAPQPYLDAWLAGEELDPTPAIREWEVADPSRCQPD